MEKVQLLNDVINITNILEGLVETLKRFNLASGVGGGGEVGGLGGAFPYLLNGNANAGFIWLF